MNVISKNAGKYIVRLDEKEFERMQESETKNSFQKKRYHIKESDVISADKNIVLRRKAR
jgi:hypothetical protein